MDDRATVLPPRYWALCWARCVVGAAAGMKRLRRLVGAYVEAIRNTPLLVQSYFLVFGLSSVGATMPIMVGAVLALVINIGAYTCEILRAGIESIHGGQIEAAECLGLSHADPLACGTAPGRGTRVAAC